jgi:membrane-associated protein
MTEAEVVIKNIGAFSYLGVFIASILANVVVPFPEEIVILAIGYLAGTGKVNVFLIIPVVIIGLLISDTVMYFLARRGAKILTVFYEKFFAKTLLTRKDWFEHHPGKVIFYTRFMMQFRFLGPFLAGQKKMPYKKFLSYELPALLIYVSVLIFVGDYFQDRFAAIAEGFGVVRNIFLIIVGVILFKIVKLIFVFVA